jgi:hypothetical protein
MTAITLQIEKMEQMGEAVKAGPGSTQLAGRVGHGDEKVSEKRRFRDACDAGGEAAGQGLRGEGGWAQERKRPSSEAKSPKSSSMENEWAIVGQAVKLCRKSKQSVLTTDKKAHVGNPRGKASASTTAS